MSPTPILIKDVITALEQSFPAEYQEDFDNTGRQLGSALRTCSGALICVDVTPEIVVEAVERGCNLIISHHPLIFNPIKAINTRSRVDMTIYKAIRNDLTIYSCHTSADNTPIEGVSWQMGRMLGLLNMTTLEGKNGSDVGSGIVGDLPREMSTREFAALVKDTFGAEVARCSDPDRHHRSKLHRVALCGGAGSFLIPTAIEAGAQAFVTSDCKHNTFLDFADQIFLVDIGHFESEYCTRDIFYRTLSHKIPNLTLFLSEKEKNPITYL